MTFTLEIDFLDAISQQLIQLAEGWRVPVQGAMANRLQDITQANFGAGDGEDRPLPWQPLSPGYAKVAHGGDTTPTEILLGDLKDSIQVEDGNPEFASVYTNLDYAATQQFGGGEWNIPARPFFPFTSNDPNAGLTAYTEAELHLAAEEAIAELARQ